MGQSKDEVVIAGALDWLARHWKSIAVLTWLGFCCWFIFNEWNSIRYFALGDTDDNMRIMQVRALLHGQDWFDLRQYRMNPPYGANIHWSRLVDLPIAGLILLLRPVLGGAGAERWAVAIAPLLPYLLLLFSLALTARRLIDPRAYPLAFIAVYFAGSTNGMFMPERIDHHGWQLALLALSMSGLADPKRLRGGLTLGISSALSLAIGLEMIIYIAMMGVAMALFWVADAAERDRLRSYAVSLGGATALSFLLFASYANRAPVCDALSPVWLSDVLLGGALLYGLSLLAVGDWRKRLALALAAGVVLAGFHAVTWPNCLQRLEGVSPEVYRLWLSHVKEARPIYTHGWRIASMITALPITGLLGWAIMVSVHRRDPERLRRILGAAVPGIAATVLLLWQTRTGPAAQMLATIGAAAFVWYLLPLTWRSKSTLVLDPGDLRNRNCRLRVCDSAGGADSGAEANAAGEGDRQGELAVQLAVGLSPRGAAAEGDSVHVRRPGPAADRGHASRCDYRPLSSQRSADRRRDERLPRERRPGAAADREISIRIIC